MISRYDALFLPPTWSTLTDTSILSLTPDGTEREGSFLDPPKPAQHEHILDQETRCV